VSWVEQIGLLMASLMLLSATHDVLPKTESPVGILCLLVYEAFVAALVAGMMLTACLGKVPW